MIDVNIAKIERRSNTQEEETTYEFSINEQRYFNCNKRELIEIHRSITRFFKEVENMDATERI
ncbi:MAG: hypothetical protein LIP01_04970 [Tannerellaceae bacterium]|nr:hypothetical protein [Tannerellaceae bacterium]